MQSEISIFIEMFKNYSINSKHYVILFIISKKNQPVKIIYEIIDV